MFASLSSLTYIRLANQIVVFGWCPFLTHYNVLKTRYQAIMKVAIFSPPHPWNINIVEHGLNQGPWMTLLQVHLLLLTQWNWKILLQTPYTLKHARVSNKNGVMCVKYFFWICIFIVKSNLIFWAILFAGGGGKRKGKSKKWKQILKFPHISQCMDLKSKFRK